MGAPVECYIDPAAGSNVTGDGTIGNPYASLQYAHDNFTKGTDGTRYNVKSGGTDTTGNSSITMAAGTFAANLYVQGYTATAGDGGKGHIDTGTANFLAASYNYLHVADMEIDCLAINVANSSLLLNCIINGDVTSSSINAKFIGCEINGTALINSTDGEMRFCKVTHSSGYGIQLNAAGSSATHNIVVSQSGASTGIWISNQATANNNSLYASAAIACGIETSTNSGTIAYNNLIEGYTTALKIPPTFNKIQLWANSSFGHATLEDFSTSEPLYQTLLFPNVALAESPFVNAASGNFTPKNIAGVNNAFSQFASYRGALPPATGGGGGASFPPIGPGGLVY